MIECKKCIHYPVCDHSRDYFRYDECSYYSEESRQHGEWIEKSKFDRLCKNCGQQHIGDKRFANFCPKCGALMTEKALEILRKRGEAE